MRPGAVVRPQVLGQHAAQMMLTDDQRPVQQLPARGTDDSRADRVRSGRAGWRESPANPDGARTIQAARNVLMEGFGTDLASCRDQSPVPGEQRCRVTANTSPRRRTRSTTTSIGRTAPARRRAAEAAARTGRSRRVPRPKTHSRRCRSTNIAWSHGVDEVSARTVPEVGTAVDLGLCGLGKRDTPDALLLTGEFDAEDHWLDACAESAHTVFRQ